LKQYAKSVYSFERNGSYCWLKINDSSYDLIFATWISSVPSDYSIFLQKTHRFPLICHHISSDYERRQSLCCEIRLAITDIIKDHEWLCSVDGFV